MAEVLTIDTHDRFQRAVELVSAVLKSGELVAVPTETVYGLAANGLDADAVARIFETKGRPAHNPVILHVANLEMARGLVSEWNDAADKLARSFWPGPLTIVLPRSSQVPDVVTAGGETVAIRWPGHPFIQAVIRECGFPLAAPSANLSNRISPTNAGHVASQLGDHIPLIVDAGQCHVGIESTVVDVSVNPPRLLRPGMIQKESLEAVLGRISESLNEQGALKSPGQLLKHYSPKAVLKIASWENERALTEVLIKSGVEQSSIHVIAHTKIFPNVEAGQWSVIPYDPEAYARALYAEWHRCDEAGAKLILIEAVPETTEWQGIRDRLKRAST